MNNTLPTIVAGFAVVTALLMILGGLFTVGHAIFNDFHFLFEGIVILSLGVMLTLLMGVAIKVAEIHEEQLNAKISKSSISPLMMLGALGGLGSMGAGNVSGASPLDFLKPKELSDMDIKELRKALDAAVEKQDFDKAAEIRNEITRRESRD